MCRANCFIASRRKTKLKRPSANGGKHNSKLYAVFRRVSCSVLVSKLTFCHKAFCVFVMCCLFKVPVTTKYYSFVTTLLYSTYILKKFSTVPVVIILRDKIQVCSFGLQNPYGCWGYAYAINLTIQYTNTKCLNKAFHQGKSLVSGISFIIFFLLWPVVQPPAKHVKKEQ